MFSYLRNKEGVTELFREVAAKVANRPGGYTRILKTGTRVGDSAEMCIIELVDFNTNYSQGANEAAKKTTTRRRRSSSKKADNAVVADAVEVKEEAPAADENKEAKAE